MIITKDVEIVEESGVVEKVQVILPSGISFFADKIHGRNWIKNHWRAVKLMLKSKRLYHKDKCGTQFKTVVLPDHSVMFLTDSDFASSHTYWGR